jgi:predicted DNA-binding transcriptional regulator AlpA
MNDTHHPAATCRLIRMPEVLAICGMPRATLYREIKAKRFPAQVRLSARSVGWLEDEVDSMLHPEKKKATKNPLL